MDRSLVWILAAVLALSTVVPTASAHNCNSGEPGGCGPCTDGEQHAHNDPENQCSSGYTPGFTAPLLIAGLGAALALVGVARRD